MDTHEFAEWLQGFQTTLIAAIKDEIYPMIESGELDEDTARELAAAAREIGDLRCELHDIGFNRLRPMLKRLTAPPVAKAA